MKDGKLQDIREHLAFHHWWVESLIDRIEGYKQVSVGRTGFLRHRPYRLRGKNLRQHKHVIGTSGYGTNLATMCGTHRPTKLDG